MQRLLLTEQKGLPASKALNFFFFFLTKHPRVRIRAPVCVLSVLGSVFIVQAEGNTELRGLG